MSPAIVLAQAEATEATNRSILAARIMHCRPCRSIESGGLDSDGLDSYGRDFSCAGYPLKPDIRSSFLA